MEQEEERPRTQTSQSGASGAEQDEERPRSRPRISEMEEDQGSPPPQPVSSTGHHVGPLIFRPSTIPCLHPLGHTPFGSCGGGLDWLFFARPPEYRTPCARRARAMRMFPLRQVCVLVQVAPTHTPKERSTFEPLPPFFSHTHILITDCPSPTVSAHPPLSPGRSSTLASGLNIRIPIAHPSPRGSWSH